MFIDTLEAYLMQDLSDLDLNKHQTKLAEEKLWMAWRLIAMEWNINLRLTLTKYMKGVGLKEK